MSVLAQKFQEIARGLEHVYSWCFTTSPCLRSGTTQHYLLLLAWIIFLATPWKIGLLNCLVGNSCIRNICSYWTMQVERKIYNCISFLKSMIVSFFSLGCCTCCWYTTCCGVREPQLQVGNLKQNKKTKTTKQ